MTHIHIKWVPWGSVPTHNRRGMWD